MSEQPSGNLDNPTLSGRFKHYSRPTQYAQRPKPQLFSDVTDQFAQVSSDSIKSVPLTQPIQPPQPIKQTVNVPQSPLKTVYEQPQQQNFAPQPRPQPVIKQQVPARPVYSQPTQSIESFPQQQRVIKQPAMPPVISGNSLLPKPPQQQQYVQPAQNIPLQQTINPQQVQQQVQTPRGLEQELIDQAQSDITVPIPNLNSQVQAPLYTNNYQGEYEDQKGSRFDFSFRRSNKPKRVFFYASSLAVTVLLAGAFVVFMNWNNNSNIAQAQSNKTPKNTISGNVSLPSSQATNLDYASSIEPTKTQYNNYVVGPALPRYLIIPKFNISGMITPISLDSNNNIKAPSNIFNAGWWQSSSEPGQPGATVLDGFTTNGTSPGIFASLDKLSPGDTFQIQVGNGTKYSYKVDKSVDFGTNGLTMDEAVSPVTAGKPGVNIITCSGLTLTCPTSGNGDFVVFAEQM